MTLRSLFRREDSRTVMHSPDTLTSSRAPAPDYATLGPIAVAQAGPAASRIASAPDHLSPVVRNAAARISGTPIA